MAEVAGLEQVWTAQGFHDRFALPLEPGDTGFGHTSEQVAQVRAPAELLAAYSPRCTSRRRATSPR